MKRPLPQDAHLSQPPTQPLALHTLRKPGQRVRWIMLLSLCGVVLGGVLVGLALLHQPLAHSNSQHLTVDAQPALPVLPAMGARQAERSFMDALMQKHWTVLWSLLHRDAQQAWRGEQDFTHFEQAKFGAVTFITSHSSDATLERTWRDPDTTALYPVAATFSVTLRAVAPKGVLSAPSALALSRGLFTNTLLALVPDAGTWKVLVAGPADQDAPLLVPAVLPAVKVLVPVFMYHHISNQPTTSLFAYNLTVTRSDFDQQLTWLQQQGYHTMTLTELFDALYDGKALPAHPVILTFDDGYEDVYLNALPVLLAHHDRGVFNIITGMIGGTYVTWDQVRSMARDGMQIASHTIHHVNVGNPPLGTSTWAELTLSQRTLEAQLDQPIQFFCYPSGEPFHYDTVAQQQEVLHILSIDDYVGATLDPFSLFSAAQRAQVPYELPRIRVSGGESLTAFMGILNYTLRIGFDGLSRIGT